MNHLDEIRAKLSVEELVGGYVPLKKAGRNLKGLCPFHNDSRPSFMVSPEKGIAYCFSCNTGGDIFKFIQLIEKVDFPEAVSILADRTGVRLPTFNPEVQDEKRQILKANESTTDFFISELKKSNVASNYFKNRALTDEAISTFRLGFAPDSYNLLKDHLIGAGFSEKELLTAGLLNQRSISDKNTYARFRNRMIFPIWDHQGNIVGFGGRILNDGEPKYLNSPDTPVYNKSYVLYGLHLAKEAIKQDDLAIFVEGYMDVISCHQAGSKNVIATSGTALTAGQLKLIKRYTNNIAFAFDQDGAGMEATRRAIELAKETEMNVKIIMVPNGKDPDDCVREDKQAWFNAIEKATPAIDFYFSHAFKLYDKNVMEGKKEILNFLLPIIKLYPTNMEQDTYLNRLAFELKTDVKFLWADMKKMKVPTYIQAQAYPASQNQPTAQKRTVFSREDFLLGFVFSHPDLYKLVSINLINNAGFDINTETIYKTLKKRYDSKGLIDLTELKNELPEEMHEKMNILPLLIEEQYSDLSHEKVMAEMLMLIKSINQKNIKTAQKDCEFRIRSTTDSNERTLLLNEYNQILKLSSKLS